MLTINYPNSAPIEGTAVSGVQATFTDPVADPASNFSTSIDWGDGTVTAGTVSGSGGSYSVGGSHTYADEASLTATISVIDSDGSSASASSAVTVGEGDNGTLAGRTLTLGINTPYTGPVASFTDVYLGQTASDWTATVNWGDGTTTPGVITGGSGNFLISGTHTFTVAGTNSLIVILSEDPPSPISNITIAGSTTVVAPFNMTANALDATEGTAFSGLVASYTDNLGGDGIANYSATISWGDGSTNAGTVSTSGGAAFSVSGSHVYADEGTFAMSVTLTDADGSTSSASSNVTVAEADNTNMAGRTLTLGVNIPYAGPVASFTDVYLEQTASDWTASINWGDGTTSPGVVTGGNGNFLISGTHTYTASGLYSVFTTLREDSSSSLFNITGGSATVVVPFATAANALNPTEGTAFSGLVARFIDNLGADPTVNYSATISWGDGSTSAGTVTLADSILMEITGSHTYADEGSFTVSVALSDSDGTNATASSPATVAEADSFLGTGKTLTGAPGSAVSGVVAMFADSNAAQTSSDLVAAIDWGDGTATTGTVSGSGGSFAVSGTHIYALAGTYTITTSLGEDSSAARTTATGTALVVSLDRPLTITAIGATSFGLDAAAGIMFTDADPLGKLLQYSATIDWGDHTTSAATIGRNLFGRGFFAGGTHKYTAPGTFIVSVTVADVQGARASRTTTVKVRARSSSPGE